jgi:predicted dehydrogenase
MTESKSPATRREFLKDSSIVLGATALAGVAVPGVHAGEDNTIQIALVGCGGRGTGAATQALSTAAQGPIKLVAMADVFEDRLARSYKELTHEAMDGGDVAIERRTEKKNDQVDVPPERRFVGFDAYQKAMDCLKPGDIVLLTTPPAFRWPMFQYAISKGLHTFMEKPVAVDGPSGKKMIALAAEADKKGLKAAVGLMCRHCAARNDLYKRIRDGAIGDLIAFRSFRQVGGGGLIGPNKGDMPELMYQIRNFHGFLWASGGVFMDYMIHNIDECCMMKDAWPIKAQGQGARTYREDKIDQNFDNYSIEYTFADGTSLFVYTRNIPNCKQEFASYVHGTKAAAVISTAVHTPAKCRIFSGQDVTKRKEQVWAFPQPEPNPYQLEWDHFIAAIRDDKPYNEVKRGTEASLITSMGRMAVHTGQVVTWDDILNAPQEFAPYVDQLAKDSPAPLQMKNGAYPQPEPGIKIDREF